MMLNKPVFKYHFHAEVEKKENAVYLLSENRHFILQGGLYVLLAPLLDGKHTVSDIIEYFDGQFSEEKIKETLLYMEQRGYITEAAENMSRPSAAFWNLLDFDLSRARKQLNSTKVSVRTFGEIKPEPFIELLNALGIQTAEDGDITVILTDDYQRQGLDEFNRDALKSKRPWVIFKPVGAVVWLGPLFIPGETGCWKCLEYRLEGNREVETTLQKILNTSRPFPTSRASLSTTLQTGLSLAATETARCVIDRNSSRLKGKITTFDIMSLSSAEHILTRRPQCRHCGTPGLRSEPNLKPWTLQSRKTAFSQDGGCRICSPAETLKRCKHLISPITGIISELKPVYKGGGDLITIYYAGNRTVKNVGDLRTLKVYLRLKATGKGRSALQCQTSGLGEAIERYCYLYEGDEPVIKKSANQLGDSAVKIEDCLLISKSQYENRSEWNRKHCRNGLYNFIPRRLETGETIEWSPIWSLTSREYKYIPTAYCYASYPHNCAYEDWFCIAETNGLAAGNVIEEALLHGFVELVERDSVSIWWYNRLKMPAVDLNSFEDPYFDALQSYYNSIGRELWVLDVTNDLNIPAFTAVSRRTDGGREELIFGCGAHPEAKIGISRALTELNQFLYLLAEGRISGKSVLENDITMKKWFDEGTIKTQPYMAPDEKVKPRDRNHYPKIHSGDILEDITGCVDMAKKNNLEVLAVDMSRPDIDMKVVRVIIPGLRAFPARFGKGRLSDVPVKMGWRNKPVEESELNPFFMWI